MKNEWYEFREALEALYFCTREFTPESEVIQSYCHKSMIAQTWRFKNRIKIAKELGYIECIQRKGINLIRLTEKGDAKLAEWEQSKSWNKKENIGGDSS